MEQVRLTREEVVVVERGVWECNFKEIMEERLLARGNFDDTKEAISKRWAQMSVLALCKPLNDPLIFWGTPWHTPCDPRRRPPFLSSASLIKNCVKDQISDRCATFQNQTRPVLEKYKEKLIKVLKSIQINFRTLLCVSSLFFYRFLLPAPLKRWRRMFWPLSRPKTQPPKTTSRKFSVGRQLLSMKTIPIFFLQRAKKCKFGTTAV